MSRARSFGLIRESDCCEVQLVRAGDLDESGGGTLTLGSFSGASACLAAIQGRDYPEAKNRRTVSF